MKPKRYCLDTWALLTLIGGEAGADAVEKTLTETRSGEAEAYMCTVTLAELYNVVSREKGFDVANKKYVELKTTGIRMVAPDEQTAISAGALKTKYRFSLADSFCLATALTYKAKIVTGDPNFSEVTECEIVWLRPQP